MGYTVRLILLFFTVSLFYGRSSAQTFHIRCISIDASGGTTVTWDRSGLNPAGFSSYKVFHSTAQTGPFTAVDSILVYSDTVTTHAAANASVTPAWYFIVCKSAGVADVVSDTVRALQLVVLNPGSGYAVLGWNVMHTPLIATHSNYYQVYREYPAGVFTLIDSVNAALSGNPMRYNDLISICDDTVDYRIEVMDQSGCRSVSNIDGDRFRDLQPPMMPVLDSVSVDINGNVVIGWPPDPSPDTRAYVILQGVGSIWTPIDTLFGIGTTNTATAVNASSQSVSFQLIAVDSCGNPSAQSLPHTTIHLTGTFDRCDRSVTLSWNPYTYWNSLVLYDVYRSTAGGAEQLIGSVTGATAYEDTAIISGTPYCYRVVARQAVATRSSTSSRFCVTPFFPTPPTFCRIRSVSVRSGTLINVTVHTDAAAVVQGYRLLRSNAPGGPFSPVAAVNGSGGSLVDIPDPSADPSERVYYYQVVVIDSCGRPVRSSQVSRSVLLRGEALTGASNSIRWTTYGEWSSGVDRYLVFRTVNGIRDPFPVAVVPGGQTLEFTDLVLDDFYSDGTFCYQVTAVQAPGDTAGFVDEALSNELCLVQEPQVFIPNAFHPGGGLNEIFRPYPVFVPQEDYRFVIYDRWGQVVFSTDNPGEGWDGSINGAASEQAVYVYLLEARKPDGVLLRKVGAVTLLRN
ncbi:MAG: hypothetical protein RL021_734 [Bacteroidota bacterium]